MIEVVDQTGNTVRLSKRPDRIVSVVPSQTELLSDLGLDDNITGITKFCIHPEHVFRNKTRVGGTKALNIAKIRELNPDLIIANKEENLKSEIEELKREFPLYVSDILKLSDSLEMIQHIGILTNTEEKSNQIVQQIEKEFKQLDIQLKKSKPLTCLYLIWKSPWMAAGKSTFIDDILSRCKLVNIIEDDRYPEYSEQEIIQLNPEVVILSSEPFPFKEEHKKYLNKLLPDSKIILADGEMFSWYGSRLLIAPAYLAKLRSSQVGLYC